MGRGAAMNGNGRSVLPPVVLGPIVRYRQPPRRNRFLRAVAKGAIWLTAVLATVAVGLAGGAYLYFDHEVVSKVQAKTKEVKEAAKTLDIVPANRPAIALLVGYDRRFFGPEKGSTGLSDTIMLIRADPRLRTLSMLSFPRDLVVDVHCPGGRVSRGRINSAYAICGIQGTLETVRALTGLPINYLITVNFRGFRQLVADVGGVWVDIDHRYFNDNTGSERFATIDLQPGYQKLNGQQALDFVRFRHTDSDIHRNARQQEFVGALRAAITSSFSPTKIPKLVRTITDNVEVGVPGNKKLSKSTVFQYALFAYQLPPGHLFRSSIDSLTQDAEYNLFASTDSVRTAVDEFVNPDVDAPDKATAVALGRKVKKAGAPPARETTVVVLNGNGVEGSAANGSYLLGKLGYRTITPALAANAPSADYFHTKVYFDRRKAGARLAAVKVSKLFGDADVEPVPPEIKPMQTGAMLVVVTGQTFDGRLAPAPVDQTPTRQPPAVVKNPDEARPVLRWAQKRVPFRLMLPTVIERNSSLSDAKPIRVYRVAGRPAVRLTFSNGANEYWGIQETTWTDAPILEDPNERVRSRGRVLELHYTGSKLHLVAIRDGGSVYWVVNTLLNRLSNETMLAIAKGLQPMKRPAKAA
jgi:LCP family protein required for cell wall assembly